MSVKTEPNESFLGLGIEKVTEAALNLRPHVFDVKPDQVFLVPPGMNAMTAREVMQPEKVERIKARRSFTTVDAFQKYRSVYAPESIVFANHEAMAAWTWLDYHQAQRPDFCDHVATVSLTPTQAWRDWSSADRRSMDQEAFARFIEAHAEDFKEPAGAAVLDAVLQFETSTEVNFSSKPNLTTGRVQFTYTETAKEGMSAGSIDFPRRFVVEIEPFVGLRTGIFECLVRYRINDGRLSLWYEIRRKDDFVLTAFQEMLAQLKAFGVTPLQVSEQPPKA